MMNIDQRMVNSEVEDRHSSIGVRYSILRILVLGFLNDEYRLTNDEFRSGRSTFFNRCSIFDIKGSGFVFLNDEYQLTNDDSLKWKIVIR